MIPRSARLPTPDPAAQAHSEALVAHIRDTIAARGGRISFRDYMDLALYAPGLGYYTAGAHKLGEGGDFTTAPELSPLFSRCLARQCLEVLERSGGEILEFGAGSGVMARDLLAELQALQALPERYLILEPSPDLRQRQRTTLATSPLAEWAEAHVHWLDTLPDQFTGVILANEVVDAMPIHRLWLDEDGPREAWVGWDGRFRWQAEPLSSAALEARAAVIDELTEGRHPYLTEVNLMGEAWMESLGTLLHRGAVIVIDYGFPAHEFYHPQRDQGTLMCHYRHHAHDDPFVYPGLQDITAHVDFTALAKAAQRGGLELLGYTAQAFFLIGLGLESLLAETQGHDYLRLAQQVKRLTLPGEMGELFKVLMVGRGVHGLAPSGFAWNDRRDSLGL